METTTIRVCLHANSYDDRQRSRVAKVVDSSTFAQRFRSIESVTTSKIAVEGTTVAKRKPTPHRTDRRCENEKTGARFRKKPRNFGHGVIVRSPRNFVNEQRHRVFRASAPNLHLQFPLSNEHRSTDSSGNTISIVSASFANRFRHFRETQDASARRKSHGARARDGLNHPDVDGVENVNRSEEFGSNRNKKFLRNESSTYPSRCSDLG